jgi:hypothetical protein
MPTQFLPSIRDSETVICRHCTHANTPGMAPAGITGNSVGKIGVDFGVRLSTRNHISPINTGMRRQCGSVPGHHLRSMSPETQAALAHLRGAQWYRPRPSERPASAVDCGSTSEVSRSAFCKVAFSSRKCHSTALQMARFWWNRRNPVRATIFINPTNIARGPRQVH